MFPRLASRTFAPLAKRALVANGKRAIQPSIGSMSMMAYHANRTMSSTAAQTVTNPDMFCRQCEQTKDNYACTTVGICGKTAETAAIQDAVTHVVKSVSLWCTAARAAGATAADLKHANIWTLQSVFSTLTNVNFSDERTAEYIREGMTVKKGVQDLVKKLRGKAPTGDIADLDLSGMTTDQMEEFGVTVSVPNRQAAMNNADCFSLNEIGTYGSRGVCAYAAHCHQLGYMDEEVMAGIHEVYSKLASNEADMEGLLANALRVGEINAKVLAMLDDAHATTFGVPTPTPVKLTATAGKCILISGHDLADLEALLKQTQGTGVNVYTHGEMLPAHGYPNLKAYPHLVGNYGTAWQNQKFEFAGFPGPVIITTNCVVEPRRVYKSRLFTMNEVGVDGVQHIGPDRDFSQVIAMAQSMKGFPRTIEPADYHTVGFNHRVVLPLAGDIIAATKSGALSRIVLIGGCDGSQWDRK
jgi:hydroxylamine reductase